MTFPGFADSDFQIFSLPDFSARMAAIRAELRPKLVALGEELAPRMATMVPGPIFPHAAAHMRRRTNPPSESWVAFGRSARGYKRFVHFRVAVNEGGLRVTVHVEDDADDKATFAAALREEREALLTQLAPVPDLVWYSLRDRQEGPVTGPQITAAKLNHLAVALSTLKTVEFSAGIPTTGRTPASDQGRTCRRCC